MIPSSKCDSSFGAILKFNLMHASENKEIENINKHKYYLLKTYFFFLYVEPNCSNNHTK